MTDLIIIFDIVLNISLRLNLITTVSNLDHQVNHLPADRLSLENFAGFQNKALQIDFALFCCVVLEQTFIQAQKWHF